MDILKRVDIRNADEYERASLDDRKVWHRRQRDSYNLRLKQLQQTGIGKISPQAIAKNTAWI